MPDPLLSLENSADEMETRDFDLRVKKALGLALDQEIDYICEPKIDIVAQYDRKFLTQKLVEYFDFLVNCTK